MILPIKSFNKPGQNKHFGLIILRSFLCICLLTFNFSAQSQQTAKLIVEAIEYHGRKINREWAAPPSLVQFRNIYIKEL